MPALDESVFLQRADAPGVDNFRGVCFWFAVNSSRKAPLLSLSRLGFRQYHVPKVPSP